MKRTLLLLFLLSFSIFTLSGIKSYAADEASEDPVLPSIFIWELPEDTNEYTEREEEITEESGENQISVENDIINVSQPVKGYLEYSENADAIYLKDENQELVLNLKVPQKFDIEKSYDAKHLPHTTFAQNVYSYSRNGDIAYNIAPVNAGFSAKKGNFSIGTSYNESIDNSDLGFTTSFYTKYDTKYFALHSAYNKESGVAYSMVVDKFSFAPELKLNKYISVKDVITSDITRNRKQNSIVLSINPTKDDRVRFEFGAGQTFDENKKIIKSEIKFSTQFKW